MFNNITKYSSQNVVLYGMQASAMFDIIQSVACAPSNKHKTRQA